MDISVGAPSSGQAVRGSDWGVHVLVRPERSNGLGVPAGIDFNQRLPNILSARSVC
ncbi:MAG: hypothetical protein ACI8Z1_002204 [Candidatus Azotimanducaceae bacterium]|jgi:hypothetical protein